MEDKELRYVIGESCLMICSCIFFVGSISILSFCDLNNITGYQGGSIWGCGLLSVLCIWGSIFAEDIDNKIKKWGFGK